MLEKQRQSLEASKNYQKVKLHLQRNKNLYLAGGAGVGIGLVLKQRPQVTHVINTVAPVINNTPVFNNENSTIVNNGGHLTKIVKRLSDGKMWETVTEAAAEEGCSLPMMSKHLNGRSPHIYGEVYQIAGLGTTG